MTVSRNLNEKQQESELAVLLYSNNDFRDTYSCLWLTWRRRHKPDENRRITAKHCQEGSPFLSLKIANTVTALLSLLGLL